MKQATAVVATFDSSQNVPMPKPSRVKTSLGRKQWLSKESGSVLQHL